MTCPLIAFMGGTSLSIVYGVIDRFSEDADITLGYRAFDPFVEGASRAKPRMFSECLDPRVASYVREIAAPAVDAAL
ncbi:MAG: nucleotidyl transferase AbiEii/AbiGii toxin family protein [Albidovulum sp.]|nr:nucleotidyl transferase AbiEii/AbiGii toxin family protein [Albidovulum sp.]